MPTSTWDTHHAQVAECPGICPGCRRAGLDRASGECPTCLLTLGLDATQPPQTLEAGEALVDGWRRLKGRRVGHYELLDEIARGGMGIVYRARQAQPARVVALKMMLPYLSVSEGLRRRFRIESDAIACLDHPGILPVYEVGEHEGIPWFSMKFAEGGSLARRLRALRGEWREIGGLLVKIAGAIQHAHERGVLHRDLKPGNILFDARGEPMVADFGLAKFRAVDQNLTLPTAILGSPHYIAPEQINESLGPIGPAVDVYSLGAILYELLTGRPPIVADEALATLRLVSTHPPEPAATFDPDIPRGLDVIARRCLEKRPEHRYPSAAALADDLGRYLQGRTVRAGGAVRHGRRWLTGLAGLAAATAGVIVLFLHHRVPFGPVSSAGPPVVSLAVLRFTDDSKTPGQGYLADGLAGELIDALGASSPAIRVATRAASFQWQPSDHTTADPFQALAVTYILAGHVELQGERLLVRAELRGGPARERLWSATYDRPVGELADLRNLIAHDVRAALRLHDPPLQMQFEPRSRNLEAYRLYVSMRTLYDNSLPSADMGEHMIQSMRRATELDPAFAGGWALLSLFLSAQAGLHMMDLEAGFAEATRAANRAIALDPALGDGYRALAKVHLLYDRDWRAAREAIAKAVALQPRDPWTLRIAWAIEMSVGNFDVGFDLARRAVDSQPFDGGAALNMCSAFELAGKVEEAIRECRRALDLIPGFSFAHAALSGLYVANGQPTEALAEADKLDPFGRLCARAVIFEALGRRKESNIALAAAEQRFGSDPAAWAFSLAGIYAFRGDAAQAMVWLERSNARGEAEIQDAWGDLFVPIARDPRYLALLERLHMLPPSKWPRPVLVHVGPMVSMVHR